MITTDDAACHNGNNLRSQQWRQSWHLRTQIAKFMGPTWGPPGSCRPQMGLMLASWTLLSGELSVFSGSSLELRWWQSYLHQAVRAPQPRKETWLTDVVKGARLRSLYLSQGFDCDCKLTYVCLLTIYVCYIINSVLGSEYSDRIRLKSYMMMLRPVSLRRQVISRLGTVNILQLICIISLVVPLIQIYNWCNFKHYGIFMVKWQLTHYKNKIMKYFYIGKNQYNDVCLFVEIVHFAIFRELFQFKDIILSGEELPLSHWGRDEMDAISQTTFSNAFSWMKAHEIRLRFHWSLFLRFELTIS